MYIRVYIRADRQNVYQCIHTHAPYLSFLLTSEGGRPQKIYISKNKSQYIRTRTH